MSTPSSSEAKDRKRSQQEMTGCEVPFVPVTTGASSFSRFKQLSTRRTTSSSTATTATTSSATAATRTTSSPNLAPAQHGRASAGPMASAPPFMQVPLPPGKTFDFPTIEHKNGLGAAETLPTPSRRPSAVGLGFGLNDSPTRSAVLQAASAPYLSPHWTMVEDGTKDHPGRRKSSGFFQPIKHLSGTCFGHSIVQKASPQLENQAITFPERR
jgi:hypothetical protein